MPGHDHASLVSQLQIYVTVSKLNVRHGTQLQNVRACKRICRRPMLRIGQLEDAIQNPSVQFQSRAHDLPAP